MRKLIVIFSSILLFASCYYPEAETALYEVNDNFVISSDSLIVQSQQPLHNMPIDTLSDTVLFLREDAFVVAQTLVIQEDTIDSVWVKIARDQYTMGWLRQSDFLKSSVPDDPISQFIYLFSQRHLWYFVAISGIALLLVLIRVLRHSDFPLIYLRDIPSFYPSMFVLNLGGSAVLYTGIQKFVPETWVQYYFHPTLNPFELPFVLGLFIGSVWLLIVLFIATVDEVFRQLQLGQAFLYLLSLSGICILCYFIFTLTPFYWLGCVLYSLFVFCTLWRYYSSFKPRCICGHCGAKLRRKGICPQCGSNNK